MLSDTYLRPCFQRRIRNTFGLSSVPLFATDCTECTNTDGGGIGRMFAWLTATHPTVRIAFATHDADATMRTFFSYGYSSGCDFPAVMPAADFAAGLQEIEDELGAEDNFAMFVVPGEAHTFLGSGLGSTTAGTTTLAEWLTQMLSDDPTWDTQGTIP